jgi:hypothetical protein
MTTLTEQMKCVKREIDKRKNFYPRWVSEGKMTQQEADYQIETMEYVYNTLQAVKDFQMNFIAKNENLFK